MDFLQVFALAFLQGVTEFLPVSSSAHLILVPVVLGWEDQGQSFDVAVHLGTLFAVVGFYRRDVYRLVVAWFSSVTKKTKFRRFATRMVGYSCNDTSGVGGSCNF